MREARLVKQQGRAGAIAGPPPAWQGDGSLAGSDSRFSSSSQVLWVRQLDGLTRVRLPGRLSTSPIEPVAPRRMDSEGSAGPYFRLFFCQRR